MGQLSEKNTKNIELKNGALRAVLTPFGAQMTELWYKDLLIGTDGFVAGRYANRIRGGKLRIGGKVYDLDINDKGNTLHGGAKGFKILEWEVLEQSGSSIRFRIYSPDGDQGFPGGILVSVRYELTEDDRLKIDYEALAYADTVVNLTNHMYFNLNGGGPVSEHSLRIDADSITETDGLLIPTGRFLPVEGTRFDFRKMTTFVPGYDDNFVLNGSGMHTAAWLKGLRSGLSMDVATDQPGMQLYNTDTRICLETQHFADSQNHPEFPSTLLRAGETFRSETVYSFTEQ